jgi:hypothetical protein
MPERTTVVLPAPLKERAVARAREQGISFGEFVRRAVEKVVTVPPRGAAARKTGDPFWDNLKTYDGGGPRDVAAHHDEYLYGGKR